MSNKKKSEQLGMSFGKASHRLRKQVLFQLVQELCWDTCYRCGSQIETVDELSIEHIVPWLDSENPVELFFDLDNISFSHIKCNIACGRKTNRKYESVAERGREGWKRYYAKPEKRDQHLRRKRERYHEQKSGV